MHAHTHKHTHTIVSTCFLMFSWLGLSLRGFVSCGSLCMSRPRTGLLGSRLVEGEPTALTLWILSWTKSVSRGWGRSRSRGSLTLVSSLPFTVCQILPKGVVSVLGPSSSPASASTVSHICGEKEVRLGCGGRGCGGEM